MSKATYNVAVIGYGMSAKVFHIPLILALPNSFKLYGVVQRTPKAHDSASQDHPGIKTWSSADEMFKDPAVDVVVVTSTPIHHFEHTKKALEAGKHVVVEKPFVPTSKEADELVDMSKKVNRLLTVYQNRRWDLDFLTLKKVLAEGVLGDIAEFETHYDRFRPQLPPPAERTWKNTSAVAGGALFDLGSHLVDQVYHLFGPPTSVTAFIDVHKRGLTTADCVPDFFTCLLQYGGPKDRMFVTVKSSSLSAEEAQLRFWVRGNKGSFVKHYLDMQEEQLKGGMKFGERGFGIDPESHYGSITTEESGQLRRQVYPSIDPPLYVEYYRLFANALQGRCEVPVSPQDAVEVLKILEMAQESAKSGQVIKWAS